MNSSNFPRMPATQPTCHKELSFFAARAGLWRCEVDPQDPDFATYHASCGHRHRLSLAILWQLIHGEAALTCAECQAEYERSESNTYGWRDLGPDPDGARTHRIYRHRCGHEQRIARAAMRKGPCSCAGCGDSWVARPSCIYLIEVRLGDRHVIKLGFSANLKRRFEAQLKIPEAAEMTLLRKIPMPSGHLAHFHEKRIHAALLRDMPRSVVPSPEHWPLLKVESEVYRPWARGRIEGLLDALEEDLAAHGAAQS